MRKSGRISALALKKTLGKVGPGVSLLELEEVAQKEIRAHGASSAFKTVEGYQYTTCLTINDEVVHGLPRDIKLKAGDLLSIDLGARFNGWCTDTAWSVVVGQESNFFLNTGEKALWQGIDQAIEGNRIGDISSAIQNAVEGSGFSVSRSLIGHGVGQALHEPPEVPGFGEPGTGIVLKSGMCLAIEVIYTGGRPEVVLAPDNWTLVSADHSLGGLFEMTVIVGSQAAEVITDWRSI